MSNYVTLLGSEQVERAGSNISHAAEVMQRAVHQLDDLLTRFLRQFEENVQRLEDAAEKMNAHK